MVSFNPRARAGRDNAESLTVPATVLFQSTRPRGARPDVVATLQGKTLVSIHAPARGATWKVAMLVELLPFQSTRPRGARRCRRCRELRGRRFNPRARAGRDVIGPLAVANNEVSIHAPARGATYSCQMIVSYSGFQSTRPRGARPAEARHAPDDRQVSIHAPARGATKRV